MFEWLINLPVWVQTPLIVVCVLAACVVLASVFHALLWRVIRPTADEREIAGYGVDGSVLKKLLLMTDRDEVTHEEQVAADQKREQSATGQRTEPEQTDVKEQSTRRTQ